LMHRRIDVRMTFLKVVERIFVIVNRHITLTQSQITPITNF
jgi:hypothetical protein